MSAQKKKLDPVTWIGIFVFAAVALMIGMLLFEAISGRDEYETEQRADEPSASAPAAPAAASPAVEVPASSAAASGPAASGG
jgi:hypothetical protein